MSAVRDLARPIPGETQREFEKRVEAAYGYTFALGDKWTLWGDSLIVCNPEREPIRVLDGGKIDKFTETMREAAAIAATEPCKLCGAQPDEACRNTGQAAGCLRVYEERRREFLERLKHGSA